MTGQNINQTHKLKEYSLEEKALLKEITKSKICRAVSLGAIILNLYPLMHPCNTLFYYLCLIGIIGNYIVMRFETDKIQNCLDELDSIEIIKSFMYDDYVEGEHD